MPTNFPTSVDVLTNPVSNDSLNSPSHSTQHANANDAIEAIEGYLLTGNGRAGLTHLNTTEFTTQSSILIQSVFSTAYDAYRIVIDLSAASTTLALNIRLASGATINSALNYNYGGTFGRSNGTTGSFHSAATSYFQFGGMTTGQANLWASSMDLFSPMLGQRTAICWQQTAVDSTSFYSANVSGYHDENNLFDGIALIPSSGTISGIARIYGYRNS